MIVSNNAESRSPCKMKLISCHEACTVTALVLDHMSQSSSKQDDGEAS